jgi:hypothetical protein
MSVKYDFIMVILVEFDTNTIIEIGPPGLILWGKYYVMAAILENGRHLGKWPTMAAIFDFSGGQRPFSN